ncbi:uncharacterized protein K452DRAFT_277748 [Aplosporella prunicola CBS 121167]|uniref:ATP synthase F0 n=1 Tax=Aplosporella prunicola CBS 121167 TaxID=1176127 RepID=A0A6A6B369_9PEZI|nr:uncharacterized protein K452DRAFT_277748 [Aplosporella prunicola CBS 121167]KAF2138048.1 hypothetical protein K452DRAFT_277748 [Aplosporella prunicola CBS 121167]
MSETSGNNNVADRIHAGVHSINPFKSHAEEERSRGSIVTHKVFTAITYLLVLITAIYYTFERPHEGHYAKRTIWGQNSAHHTSFTMNSIITSIYWLVLFILQIGYSWHLYSGNNVYVAAAANVGSHFITHNLLLFGFIHLWVRSHFWLAELLLVINFFNLSAAYFRHSTTPRFIHIPVVSGPLAWNFVALYWCGAVAVHAHNLPARIVANIFIWGILVYGMFFLAAYKDYTMGFALSILAAAIGVAQFLTKVVAFQWIFAFIIMALLFVFSLAVGVPGLLGRDPFKRGEIVDEDRERAPLLADQ